ncbi:MAG: hypothetical protein IJZ44_03685 [Lachnospiraceae bacterium]|nr:hypothetical protein [Lachnospiraceae bacterium]
MTGMEIVLLILGVVVFVASFIIPESKKDIEEQSLELGEEKVKEIINSQMKEAKLQLQDVVDETLSYAVEKSERSLERVSNEKITAVSEFSETVLGDIHKSHQEVMFLYDMLHDKQKNLFETAKEVDKTSAKAKETKNELETAAKLIQEELIAETVVKEKKNPEPEKGDTSFENLPIQKVFADENRVVEPVAPVVAEEVVVTDDATNNNELILKLHKQGKSNVAIAKELGLGVGEVNLVIDLFEVM